MSSELPSGLPPLEKTQSFAEAKPSHLQSLKNMDGEGKSGLMPEADRVQLSEKTQFSQGAMTQHLTSDKNLNAYIIMLKQAAELEDTTNDNSLYKTLMKKNNQGKRGPDVFA